MGSVPAVPSRRAGVPARRARGTGLQPVRLPGLLYQNRGLLSPPLGTRLLCRSFGAGNRVLTHAPL
jgi:hypothetical protein